MSSADGAPGGAMGPPLVTGAAVAARPRPRAASVTLVAAGLALLTVWTFLPALDCGFVAWDDPQTVAAYGVVLRGLTAEGLLWAFTESYFAHWLPLTVLSHMLDWELFGADARGHHLTSVLLHVATAVLTFLVLRRATGEGPKAAAVAALWAVHPLRVEPVVWVAARKDMLSGALGMLALLLYVRWAQSPSRGGYAAVLAALFLGILAKPMLVTVPLVMLLLDYWPLGRLRLEPAGPWRERAAAAGRAAWPLVREKLPLFGLALAAAAGAVVSQRLGGAMAELDELAPSVRLANAFLSYARYLGDTVWPAGLAAFYPFPMVPEGWGRALPAAALLVALTAGSLLAARRWPWLACGWLWFVVMILPVSGLVQVGDQARADRYTYLPAIGLLTAVVWSAAEAVRQPWSRRLLALGAVLLVAASALAARRQIVHWRDTDAVFARMLAVTSDNHVGHLNLATSMISRGVVEPAIPHLREVVRIRPGLALGWANLGSALRRQGDRDAARAALLRAVQLDPGQASAHLHLAALLEEEGEAAAAVGHLAAAIAIEPAWRAPWQGISALLARPGVARQALPYVAAVARERPTPEVRQLLERLRQVAGEGPTAVPPEPSPVPR